MKPTLLVMAAGMGSRYGGLKQIDPVGPNDEIIIEYSIYDAIRAGFGKIVFVVRKDFEQAFKEKVGDKIGDKIEIVYTYQELDKCLGGHTIPEGRVKPWGTGHAILVANELINEPFAVINADDFYGKESFEIMAKYLAENAGDETKYAMAGYVLRNTLSDHGSVSRGVCDCDENGKLKKIVEHTEIYRQEQGGLCKMEDGSEKQLTGDEPVSMNFWGFQVGLFDHLKQQFSEFLAQSGNELKSEFYIPFVVDRLINEGKVDVEVLKTEATWFGVTYQEDKAFAQDCVAKLVEQGVYPANLWA